MTAASGITPEEKERAVLHLLAGAPPAKLADALAIDVHEVLAWAQVYLHAGRAALASRTPAGGPVTGSTTRCDAQVADKQGDDGPGGGSAGTEGGKGGSASPPVTFSVVAGPRADLDRVREAWQDIVGTELAARTQPPELLQAPPSVTNTDMAAFRIAEFRHDPGIGGQLVLRLRGGLRERGLTDVVAEEGFFLKPAGTAGGAASASTENEAGTVPAPRWETVWWQDDLRAHQAFEPTPVPVGAVGAELLKQPNKLPRFALCPRHCRGRSSSGRPTGTRTSPRTTAARRSRLHASSTPLAGPLSGRWGTAAP